MKTTIDPVLLDLLRKSPETHKKLADEVINKWKRDNPGKRLAHGCRKNIEAKIAESCLKMSNQSTKEI